MQRPSTPDDEAAKQGFRIPHLRWVIAGMLFFAAVLNYIDRVALAQVWKYIKVDFGLSLPEEQTKALEEAAKTDENAKKQLDAQNKRTADAYGRINQLFLIAYTVAFLLSGRLVDWIGPRIGMAVFLTWWSVSNAMTGLARSVTSMGIFRFSLGFGEAGNWPASTKAVSEWFPPKERALAIGIYTMGASIGATVAPLLILWLAGSGGNWQRVFMATGLLGLVWVVPWIWLYRRPQEHPRITASELAMINQSQAAAAVPEAPAVKESELHRWVSAFSRRDVWLLMIARLLTDPVWYFYQQWFTIYLDESRGQKNLSVMTVVYLAADVGTIVGGLASAWLIGRRLAPANSRLWVMLACAAVMPLSPLVTAVSSVWLSLALAGAIVLAHLAWLANISALIVDVIPRRLLATCFGIAAAGSALGGVMMQDIVKGFAASKNYAPWFGAMAFLHPVAWALLWFLLPRPQTTGSLKAHV